MIASRINVPKHLQQFPSFPYPKEWKTSYISRQQCLEYINRFTDHFKLRQYIRVISLQAGKLKQILVAYNYNQFRGH